MGVFTARAHASITALAALATASASADWTEKSPVKDFRRLLAASEQSMLVSPLYNGSLFAFDPFGSLRSCNNSPISSSRLSRSSSCLISARAPSLSADSVTSKSTCLQVYRASPASSRGPTINYMPGELGLSSSMSPAQFCSFLRPLTRSYGSLSEFRSMDCQSVLPLCLYTRSSRKLLMDIGAQANFSSTFLQPASSCSPVAFQPPNFERLLSLLTSSYSVAPFSISAKLLHTWHSPNAAPFSQVKDNKDDIQREENTTTTVVLLGWLGAQQKHLRRYAEWYTSRGIHAVTFVVPMRDLLTCKPGNKAEKHIDMLTHELTRWLKDEIKEGGEKYVIFHTFSNTGWLTYGAILEKLLQQGDNLLDKIKGCVVDSAPAAKPDPQVWASGFFAALLKKQTNVVQHFNKIEANAVEKLVHQQESNLAETAIHAMLEKFFSVFLKVPYVNRRLSDITLILTQQQPSCPQLYIYSTADNVIPVQLVESFIDEQRKAGRTVRACNFQQSPHVDHFRTFPDLYSDQLNRFLKQCFPERGCE